MKGKTKKSALWVVMLSGASMLLTASCTKGGALAPERGIVISASMPGTVGGTRTSYSGKDQGGNPVGSASTAERIDWTDGDLLTVYSPEAVMMDNATHETDYRVVSHLSPPANPLLSRAVVEPTDESAHGLQWGPGNEDYHFFAMYPSVNTAGFPASELAWIGLYEKTMKGTIPQMQKLKWSGLTGAIGTGPGIGTDPAADAPAETENVIKGVADMKYAWMFAKTTTPARAEEVRLDFYPKFTAFEFTVGSGDNPSVTLSTFKLETSTSGVFLSGDFSLDGETGAVTVKNTGASNSISLTFPSGVVVTPEKKLIFTVFTLPVNLTDLKIAFTGTEIGTRELALNTAAGVPLEFEACKKYRITGLRFPSVLTATGEEIIWDLEAHGESLDWY